MKGSVSLIREIMGCSAKIMAAIFRTDGMERITTLVYITILALPKLQNKIANNLAFLL